MTTISLRGRGARGEGVADVARRTGTIAGIPVASDATDEQVMDALTDGLEEVVAAASYSVIEPVAVTTTANITLSGEQTIDGVATSASRVLVKNQSSGAANGIYVSGAGAWTRATDFDTSGEVVTGAFVQVEGGSQAGGWVLVTAGTITVGTTAQTWRPFSYRSASKVPFLPAGTGAVARTVQSELRDWIKPHQFGADPTGAVNSDDAFNAAIDYAVSVGRGLDLMGGSFKLSSGAVNFARAGPHIRGGGATLTFTGTGRAFVLDQGGADGEFLEGMSVEDIVIVGNANTTDGFYARGVVRSVFRNIEVRNVGGKAFHIKHGVSSHYDGLRYSPAVGETAYATHGLYLDNNGAGYYTANCLFSNPIMEDFAGVGCQLADATGNLFHGGTFEACTTGLVISAASDHNRFDSLWCEANTSADVVVSGNLNGFINPRLGSSSSGLNVQIQADGDGTWFAGGGYIRAVSMASGSIGTTFHGVGVDENLSGTIGFQGTGSYSRVGVKKIDGSLNVVGMYDDVIGNTGTFTLTVDQGGAVAATASASYSKVGRNVTVTGDCAITGSGSAASIVVGGLPASLAPETLGARTTMGTFFIVDNGTATYTGVVMRESDSTFSFRKADGSAVNFALANGDTVAFALSYMAGDV